MTTAVTPVPLVLGDYALEDRYRLGKGRVYMTGIQALVRLPMMQRQRDRARRPQHRRLHLGLSRLAARRVRPARCGGAQALPRASTTSTSSPASTRTSRPPPSGAPSRLNLFPGATVDGVFSIWYGKGPGVDRSIDVLKHGNAAGTSPHGGVLALVGDDHGCQSSTLPHQSEQVFAGCDDAGASIRPTSRSISTSASSAGRCRAIPAAGSASRRSRRRSRAAPSVWVDPRAHPDRAADRLRAPAGRPAHPLARSAILEAEKRLHATKMAAVARLRARQRHRPHDHRSRRTRRARHRRPPARPICDDAPGAGRSRHRRRDAPRALGIRLYKVGVVLAARAEGAREFAEGLEEVLVVEEKRAVSRTSSLRILYHLPADARPGRDRQGRRDGGRCSCRATAN